VPEVLVATDVRTRLFDALAPVLVLVEEAARGRCNPAALRIVLQLHPLTVQITVVPDEGRRARRVVAFSGSKLPDGGAALDSAVNELAAGVLAAMPEQSAEAVLLNAAVARDGGLCVLLDARGESATLLLAEPGKSLGEGVVLGGLGEVVTMH
jgi:hypothetical protein